MNNTRSSLLLDLQQGNGHQSWEEFVQLYRPLIAHAARKAGLRRQELDDLIQTVLLQLVKVLPTFCYQRERGFFRNWLYRVATNQAIDLHRRRTHERLVHVSDNLDVAEQARSPEEDTAFDEELLQAAMRCVEREFRPRTWACFIHRMVDQKPANEISRELGLSENAVFINASRVLGRLREFCVFHGEELQYEDHVSGTL